MHAATTACLAAALLSNQPAPTAAKIPTFAIRIAEPAYAGMPVWVEADLPEGLTAQYPYELDPADFGGNEIEIKREGVSLEPVPGAPGGVASGVVGRMLAPFGPPANRLPLHLRFDLSAVGRYSVRWTLFEWELDWRGESPRPRRIVARSPWWSFELRAAAPQQKEAWLAALLGRSPERPRLLVGDYLPSLLAAAPDRRVIAAVVSHVYSTEPVVSRFAAQSLRLFRTEDVSREVLAALHSSGACEELAYLISLRRQWFAADGDGIVRAVLPFLWTDDPKQLDATLRLLAFTVWWWPGDFAVNDQLRAEVDRSALAAARAALDRGDRDAGNAFASYLASIKTAGSHQLLLDLATRGESDTALVELARFKDAADLPAIAALLSAPGASDRHGRDRAKIPDRLIRAYGDQAVPWLEKALAESPYRFVRTSCAQQLALKDRPEGFRFLLEAIQDDQPYGAEMVGWVRDRFRSEVGANATEEDVAAFLRSRLGL